VIRDDDDDNSKYNNNQLINKDNVAI
jgi:hypothetical protein